MKIVLIVLAITGSLVGMHDNAYDDRSSSSISLIVHVDPDSDKEHDAGLLCPRASRDIPDDLVRIQHVDPTISSHLTLQHGDGSSKKQLYPECADAYLRREAAESLKKFKRRYKHLTPHIHYSLQSRIIHAQCMSNYRIACEYIMKDCRYLLIKKKVRKKRK